MNATRIVRWILPALLLMFVSTVGPTLTQAQIAITVTVAPPALPVYEQPPCPEEGWMWVPGYWAWGEEDGYYWVPGEWVPAPYTGALWTPPWWGWEDGRYRFHEGYWGDDVGYYGGIDYGYGYMGEGFVGGEWRDGRFAYNTAVMRVNPTVVRNVYVNQTIVRERTIANDRRIAYNGGPGGIRHDPTPIERRGMTGRHTAPTPVQQQQIQAARADRGSYAKANNGHPRTVVAVRPAGGVRNEGPAGNNRNENIGRQPGRGDVTPAPARPETRSEPGRRAPETRTEPNRYPESRPAERPRSESRPIPPPDESRPAPERRSEPRPAPPTERPRTEPRPEPQMERPRNESRPAPQMERPRRESRPEPPAREQRPAPAPHESRPAPQRESRPAPPPHESRPAEPHASMNRPSSPHDAHRAENHSAAAHPNAHPAGGEKQGKPRSE